MTALSFVINNGKKLLSHKGLAMLVFLLEYVCLGMGLPKVLEYQHVHIYG